MDDQQPASYIEHGNEDAAVASRRAAGSLRRMIRVGTAGWALPIANAADFPGLGSHLARYARVLRCAEINSSFHRSHRVTTYERWAAQTAPDFRFSVKLPRTITHASRLRDAQALLDAFFAEAAGLGDKLAVLLVQLPPSLAFDAGVATDFFEQLRARSPAAVVCEPRHASWFEPAADALLAGLHAGRVAADPARVDAAARPGGWLGASADGAGAVVYHRWHGAPRIYRSPYEIGWLERRAAELATWPPHADVWCIFDNTASGAAAANALELEALLALPGG